MIKAKELRALMPDTMEDTYAEWLPRFEQAAYTRAKEGSNFLDLDMTGIYPDVCKFLLDKLLAAGFTVRTHSNTWIVKW